MKLTLKWRSRKISGWSFKLVFNKDIVEQSHLVSPIATYMRTLNQILLRIAYLDFWRLCGKDMRTHIQRYLIGQMRLQVFLDRLLCKLWLHWKGNGFFRFWLNWGNPIYFLFERRLDPLPDSLTQNIPFLALLFQPVDIFCQINLDLVIGTATRSCNLLTFSLE
jgi:hypothetical protein